MQDQPPHRCRRPHDLEGVVCAFDLDNTLYDPGSTAYTATVRAFVELMELELPRERSPSLSAEPRASARADSPVPTLVQRVEDGPKKTESALTAAVEAYEHVRAAGDALERLGLTNPIHYRGCPDGLAVLCLTQNVGEALSRALGIDRADRQRWQTVLSRLRTLHTATHGGTFNEQLSAECALRAALPRDAELTAFRDAVHRCAEHPQVQAWAQQYPQTEAKFRPTDTAPIVRDLMERGATVVVISEGRREIQLPKLARLGLEELLSERVLVTHEAATVPGTDELEAELTDCFNRNLDQPAPDADLEHLWFCHLLRQQWSRKTPSFYGRCLHALHVDPEQPARALRRLDLCWSTGNSGAEQRDTRQGFEFVMIGDRYDTDVLPLHTLLPDPPRQRVFHLRYGKYNHLGPTEGTTKDLLPDATFTDWTSLVEGLSQLKPNQARLTVPPDIFPRTKVIKVTDAQRFIERGLTSPFQAVRLMAEMFAQQRAWWEE